MRTRSLIGALIGVWVSVVVSIAARSGAAVSLAGECGAPATRVHTIQGIGRSSPLLRPEVGLEDIVVETVVVGLFPGFPRGLGGFFVQEEDEDADGDPRTSEGLFIFDPTLASGDSNALSASSWSGLKLGDRVRVRGRVTEFFGLTELSRISEIVVCPTRGVASPTIIRLPVEDEARWEQWEGMRIVLDQHLLVTGHHNLGRFGEIALSADRRLEQPTQRHEPGGPALEWLAQNTRRRILLDDGSHALNPNPIPYLDRDDGGSLRLGDTVSHVEGVLGFAFGRFRIHPTEAPRFVSSGPRPRHPPEVEGTLRFVSWNVENYMNGNGRGGGFPTRGPRSVEEFERQRAKLIETLVRLDPDIAALVELENDGTGPDGSLDQLVHALNERVSTLRYAAVQFDAPRLGPHPIAVGMVYRLDAVTPIGPPAILDAEAHPGFDDRRNRPSLAQTFRADATGEFLTVVVNHFKSKGSNCDSVGDPDRGDGQGECNITRTRAARAVIEWLAEDPTRSGGAPVILAGDLNAYPQEDPVRTIKSAGYIDLISSFAGPGAHTFVFDGQAGRLDHALGRSDLLPFVGGAGVWHINSDEPDVFDYHLENSVERYAPDPFRSSDHDPILVGLFPDADGDGWTDSRDRCPESDLSETIMVGDCDSRAPNSLHVSGCTLSDELLAIEESWARSGRWAREVNAWLSLRIEDGTIERRNRGVILACALKEKAGSSRPPNSVAIPVPASR